MYIFYFFIKVIVEYCQTIGPAGEQERDFLQGHWVTGQGGIAPQWPHPSFCWGLFSLSRSILYSHSDDTKPSCCWFQQLPVCVRQQGFQKQHFPWAEIKADGKTKWPTKHSKFSHQKCTVQTNVLSPKNTEWYFWQSDDCRGKSKFGWGQEWILHPLKTHWWSNWLFDRALASCFFLLGTWFAPVCLFGSVNQFII